MLWPGFHISFVIPFKVLVSVEALSHPFYYHESPVDPGCPQWVRQTSQKLFRSLPIQGITRSGKITYDAGAMDITLSKGK